MLGTASIPADSLYGLAFSIAYNPALVDSGSVRVDYSGSWLGTQQQDLESIDQDFYLHSQIDIGITRTDQQERSGYGKMVDIIITVDDIAGKQQGLEFFDIKIDHIWLMRKNGFRLPVQEQPGQVAILLSEEPNRPEVSKMAAVFPNPAQDHITLAFDASSRTQTYALEIRDMQGRLVKEVEFKRRGREYNLSVADLPGGLYLLYVSTEAMYLSEKIQIQ